MNNSNRATYSMILAQLLSEDLRFNNWKQRDFLAQTGISTATWSRITRGQSSLSVEDLRAACSVLGVDNADLIRNADKVVAELPSMEVDVVTPVGPSEATKFAGMFIAAAALAFVISRIVKR